MKTQKKKVAKKYIILNESLVNKMKKERKTIPKRISMQLIYEILTCEKCFLFEYSAAQGESSSSSPGQLILPTARIFAPPYPEVHNQFR